MLKRFPRVKALVGRKSFLVWLVLGVVCVGCLFCSYQFYIKPYCHELIEPYFNVNTLNNDKAPTYAATVRSLSDLTSDTTVQQEFRSKSSDLYGFQVYIDPLDETITSDMVMTLTDAKTGKEIESFSMTAEEIGANTYFKVMLTNPLHQIKGDSFCLVLRSTDGTDQNAISVQGTARQVEGVCRINGQEVDHTLNFALYDSSSEFLIPFFIGISVVLMLLYLALYPILFLKKWPLHKVFLVVVLVLGVVYTAVFPPNSAPDERIHFAATYKNSSYVLNTPAKNEDGKVIYYQSDDSLNNKLGNIPNKAGYQTVFNHLLELRPDDDSQGFSPYSGVGIHSLLAYIPQTVGLVAGRLLHLGWIPLITLGRLTGLIFYAVVCCLAIKKIPFGKMVLFAIAVFPMSMELATSYSSDLTILSLSMFFIAYVLDLAYQKPKVRIRDILLLSAIIAILAPIKIVYVLLAFLILLIPKEKYLNRLSAWASRLAVLAGGTLLVVLLRVSEAFHLIQNGDELVDVGFSTYSIGDFLAAPFQAVKLFVNTLIGSVDYCPGTMVGSQLGWLQISLPVLLWVGFLFVALLGVLQTEQEPRPLQAKAKGLSIGIAVCTASLVILSMLFASTPVGSDTILGVQGRYFLPILPLVLLIFQNKTIVLKKKIDAYLVLVLCTFQVMSVLRVIEWIVAQ